MSSISPAVRRLNGPEVGIPLSLRPQVIREANPLAISEGGHRVEFLECSGLNGH